MLLIYDNTNNDDYDTTTTTGRIQVHSKCRLTFWWHFASEIDHVYYEVFMLKMTNW